MLVSVLALSGCGYSHNGSAPAATTQGSYRWRSLYREDVKSVAVPIFTNKDFTRGVEFQLTEAIVKELELHTPYKVMPRERADTVLEGEIVEVRRNTISNDARAAIPQEQLYTVRINFIWKDLRTGRILCERRNFEQTATYYATLGEGKYTGQMQNVEKLALGIVQELQADW
jgi:hypothetical protein